MGCRLRRPRLPPVRVRHCAHAGVRGLAFAGQLAWGEIVAITLFNYGYKLLIAIGITPLIYGAHAVMDRYLGRTTAAALIAGAEEASPTPTVAAG